MSNEVYFEPESPEDVEYKPILPDCPEEIAEFRLRMVNEAISKEKLDSIAAVDPIVNQKSLAFELSIEKKNSDDPNVGIERIASWMLRIADYYSCAVSYMKRDDETSYYRAIVCFKTKVKGGDVREVFPMAEVSAMFDYKKCFYNMIFGLAEHDVPLRGEQVVMQKIIGEIACQIESKDKLRKQEGVG